MNRSGYGKLLPSCAASFLSYAVPRALSALLCDTEGDLQEPARFVRGCSSFALAVRSVSHVLLFANICFRYFHDLVLLEGPGFLAFWGGLSDTGAGYLKAVWLKIFGAGLPCF